MSNATPGITLVWVPSTPLARFLITGKLEQGKSDLSEQLQMAIRETDDEHQRWLTTRKDKEIMREETENMRNVLPSTFAVEA